eukprot:scaffold387_cov136-Skeletonema_menzelii.AAC.2
MAAAQRSSMHSFSCTKRVMACREFVSMNSVIKIDSMSLHDMKTLKHEVITSLSWLWLEQVAGKVVFSLGEATP